jgi:fructose-specific phosphotransferase system IIC component
MEIVSYLDGCLVHWLVFWLVGQSVNLLVTWLVFCLVSQSVNHLVGWLVFWLVGQSVNHLVTWLVGCLVGWLIGQFYRNLRQLKHCSVKIFSFTAII